MSTTTKQTELDPIDKAKLDLCDCLRELKLSLVYPCDHISMKKLELLRASISNLLEEVGRG